MTVIVGPGYSNLPRAARHRELNISTNRGELARTAIGDNLMPKLKAMCLASVATLGLLMTVDRATADAWVEMTSCEQTIIAGVPLAHVQFSLHNSVGTAVYSAIMRAPDPNAPLDSCHTVTLDSPPNWEVYREPNGGAFWITTFGTDTQIGVGKTLGGFGATLSGAQCCFFIILFNAFTDPVGGSHFCFHCDLPSATSPQTWGHVKSTYR